MIFDPLTLKMLYKFKISSDKYPDKDLLTLLIDNTRFVDIKLLDMILYSYYSNVSSLKELVIKQFRRYNAGGEWICISVNFSKRISNVVWENRRRRAITIGVDNNIMSELLNITDDELCKLYKEYKMNECKRNKEIKFNKTKTEENIMNEDLDRVVYFEIDKKAEEKENSKNQNLETVKKSIESKYSRDKKIKLQENKTNEDIKKDILTESCKEVKKRESDEPCETNEDIKNKQIKREISEEGKKRRENAQGKIKENNQINVLNFEKNKLKTPLIKGKFIPLDLQRSYFLYNRENIIKETIRKRDDLINGVKLQFIKLYDQKRPAIYRKRGKVIKTIFSHKKISDSIPYDDNSSEEWEANNEDNDDSTMLATESEENEDTDLDIVDLIDENNLDDEPIAKEETAGRKLKKPTMIFEDIKIVKYFPLNKYKNANIVMSENISKDLLEDIKISIANKIPIDTISKEYNVHISAIYKKFGNDLNSNLG